jgi:hypothetical protein
VGHGVRRDRACGSCEAQRDFEELASLHQIPSRFSPLSVFAGASNVSEPARKQRGRKRLNEG